MMSKTLYLASDSKESFDKIKSRYRDQGLKVLSQEMTRSSDSQSIHHDTNYCNKAKSYSAISDCYFLSRCDYVLSTNSALSSWTKILNPRLKIRRLQHFPQNWFPVAYIKMYGSEKVEKVD